MKRLLIIAGTLALLAGCATTGPTASAISSPEVGNANFETFAYLPTLGTDRYEGVRSGVSQRLIRSTNHQVHRRGLKQSETPDLLIDFNTITQAQIDGADSSSGVQFPNWNTAYTAWPGFTQAVSQLPEGTFVIIVIDRANSRVVAQSALLDEIPRKVEDVSQHRFDTMVAKLLDALVKTK